MNTITITTELSKEDRKLLEGLMGSITLLASVLGNMQPKDVQQKIIQEVTKDAAEEHPITETTAHLELVEESHNENANEPAAPAPEVKPVSLAEFQKAVTMACAKGPKQKAAAKEIINKYAASVSAVPEDKRAEAMAELAKI
jgi:hypothetical protein